VGGMGTCLWVHCKPTSSIRQARTWPVSSAYPQDWSLLARTHSGCVLSNCWTNAHGSLSPVSSPVRLESRRFRWIAGGPCELLAGNLSLKTLHSPSPTSCSSLPQAFSLLHLVTCTNPGELIMCIFADAAFSNTIVVA